MATVTDRSKAARGTKRLCLECEVPFYDLGRDPIVCPACGVEHTPAPPRPVLSPQSHTAKTGWRRGAKREEPVAAAPQDDAETPEVEVEELADEPGAAATPDEDIVLEPEADDTDVSDLVGGHDDKDPKER